MDVEYVKMFVTYQQYVGTKATANVASLLSATKNG